MAATIVIVKVINNKSNQEEVFELEWGTINTDEGSVLIEKLENEICIDGRNLDYYGGNYSKNYKLGRN